MQQKELARLFGVDPSVVLYWEKDRRRPTIQRWRAIIEFLGFDPAPEPQSIPDHLRALRRRIGVSQKALAGLLDVDPATIQKWERGRGIPMEWRGNELKRLFELVKAARRGDSSNPF